MTDGAKIEYDFQEKGLDDILEGVQELHKKLGEAGVDAATYQRHLDKMSDSAKKVSGSLREVSKAASDNGGMTKKLADSYANLARAQDGLGYDQMRRQINEVASTYARLTDAEQAQVRAKNALNRAIQSGDTDGEVAALKRLTRATQDVAKAENDWQKIGERHTAEKQKIAQERVAAEEKAASDLAKVREREDKVYNDYLDKQRQGQEKLASDQAASTEKLAQAQKELDYSRLEKEQGAAAVSARRLADAQEEVQRATRGVIQARQAGDTAAEVAATDQLTRATKNLAAAERETTDGSSQLAAQRYALYDISNVLGIIGGAITGAGIYATVVGAQFESAFTNVERTLSTAGMSVEQVRQYTAELRNELIGMSMAIPVAFGEIAAVATLGNQMGVAREELAEFTETVIRFSSVSGMTADAVAEAFGGIKAMTGLPVQYFENFASSVAAVGKESAATEQQLLSVVREIAAGGTQAGFAVDEIVGLAGALASLQVPPERARGALASYFNTLNEGVIEGGEKAEAFAGMVGRTTAEVEKMVRAGNGLDLMQDFLGTIQSLDPVEATKALNAIGMEGRLVTDTFIRLSSASEMVGQYLQLANTSFIEGAELANQYEMTLNDLNSQWIIFINGLNALTNAVSGGAVPSIAGLLKGINMLIKAFVTFLGDNPWVAKILAIGGAVVTVLGVFLLFRAMIMRVQGSLLAFALMQQLAGAAGMRFQGSLAGSIGMLFGFQKAANGATGAALRLRMALRLLMASTGIGLLVVGLGFLGEAFLNMGSDIDASAHAIDDYESVMDGMRKTVGGSGGDGGGGATGAVDDLSGAMGKNAKAAKENAKSLRLLTDYASDLAGVFGRSSEVRFGEQNALDDIWSKWNALNKEVEEYQRKLSELQADKSLKIYALNIAIQYDDDVRAEQLRQDISELDKEIADASSMVSRELDGYSEAAIRNRAALQDITEAYGDYIKALASSGASQAKIESEIRRLNIEFNNNSSALGYNQTQVGALGARFQDFSKIVGAVPRNVDVEMSVNMGPAELAISEFRAKVAEAGIGIAQDLGDAGGVGAQNLADGLGTFEMPEEISVGMPEDFALAGEESGKGLFDSIGGWLTETDKNIWNWLNGLPEPFRTAFATVYRVSTEPLRWITSAAQWVAREVPNFFKDLPSNIGRFFKDAGTIARKEMQGIGSFVADVIENITTTFNRFIEILGGGSRGFGVTVTSGSGRGRGGGGMANGGYTGRGGKYQVAPYTIHRGEYVIPQEGVDQRSGLPRVDYVQRLASGSESPYTGARRHGYADGGYVGGGNSGPIELGAASLHYLAKAMNVRLGVDGRDIANSVSRGDADLAWTGSN